MLDKPLYGKRLIDIKFSKNPNINGRTVLGPLIAITMCSLFFVYSRSSIYAAKRNAKMHREADGGKISWQNESARRHGKLKKPEESWSWKDLVTPPPEKVSQTRKIQRPRE